MSSVIRIDRRRFGQGTAAMLLLAASGEALAVDDLTEISDLKPGDFTWHPERQPDGPVAIIVSLPEQLVHVYRNGIRIAVSTCSSGKPGHQTPTGVFVVLQKDRHHRSSTYNQAPMPNMNRLTWSGIALHAGNLPGYPASHGCVRLPLDFSDKLFSITHLGTPVIISGAHSDPWTLTHPGMVLGAYAEGEFTNVEASLDGKKKPSDWTEAEASPITSVIVSSADKQLMLIENSDVVTTGTLTIRGDGDIGNMVFILNGSNDDAQGLHWTAISHAADDDSAQDPDAKVLQRLSADPAFVQAMSAKMHPGMIMVLTDAPLRPDARTGRDFVIMS
jgi:hypothetical protein